MKTQNLFFKKMPISMGPRNIKENGPQAQESFTYLAVPAGNASVLWYT